ncbi:MAG: phosphonate C-P lyase system protein PhnH [Acetobacteraceae bacterium]|nr:phosphonate C-P lyase system protein PhnH [Acetobacteraceae bacterium]MCX7685270.1 phosphonate C-P lyase system protein PhnH [Acetobacteraceae bacterium]MDW8397025.1 phosphonate C-P lyase system protein PhnH [Acetobacteraceae bacterium]
MIAPGFADPTLDSQATFRALLAAMSHPGRVHPAGRGLSPPAPLTPALAAVALTLCDADTPLWTDAPEEARRWLAFHCGCPFAGDPARAAFVLPHGAPPPLDSLAQGTEEEPHLSATLILPVASLAEGAGWRLAGPGIAAEARLSVAGAPPGFAAAFAAQRARFPRGVDVILCAPDRLACLPRSLRLSEV